LRALKELLEYDNLESNVIVPTLLCLGPHNQGMVRNFVHAFFPAANSGLHALECTRIYGAYHKLVASGGNSKLRGCFIALSLLSPSLSTKYCNT
jgi:hypothetical protein